MQRMGPISYGTEQIEPQFLMAFILTSGPVLYSTDRHLVVVCTAPVVFTGYT